MFAELLKRQLGSLIDLSHTQIQNLEQHFLLLCKWNKKLNLTSISGLEETIERHYCESIFLGIHLPPGILRIADAGSGAGFPGIPVAICRQDCFVTLIESHQRKSVFLREATRTLSNVQVCTQRVEAVSQRFDWTICRAVEFREIENPVGGISEYVAFLGGQNCPSASRFTWNNPTRLPWGRQRYLWIGIRSST